MDLEQLYTSRINRRNAEEQAKYDAEYAIKERRVNLAQQFLGQISFLNKYGFKWELLAYCNNGHDCCMAYYAWSVTLVNKTIATSPFEIIVVDEIEGEIKGRWMNTILGHGRYVEGQDKDGWFTAEQLVMALSKN